MFRYQGLIEFSALATAPAVAPDAESGHAMRRLRVPGLEMRWNAGFVDMAVREQTLALAAGRARSAGVIRGEAARWIERYARRGEDAADDVGGGFAVVIVDFHKRRALLFVDRFAIETLCYRSCDGTLAFSDSACDVPGSDKAIDAQSLYDFLYFHVIPAPQTVYGDVRRVEAAHRVIASADGADTRRYWDPVFEEHDSHDMPGRMREFADIVKACVEEEADGQAAACFLSGGTDSSTIAGMLTRLRGEPVHAYSIGFEAEGYDEMEYARIAARHFGLVHHEYYVTPDDLLASIPKVAASVDQPFGNSSILPAYHCALQAKQDGFVRMLAGDGGDELFGGNSRYATQKLFELYHLVPRSFRNVVLEPLATEWALFRRTPGFRQIGGYVRHSMGPMPDRLDTFKLLHRLGEETILEPDFLARVDTAQPLTRQRATWHAAKADSLVNRMLAYDWKYTLADSDLPKVRGAAQLAGVTVGYPFLGRALTDFSLSLPAEWKLKGLKLRWFFKKALRGFLPEEVLRKKKHGFGLPFGHWVLRHTGLRELTESSLEGIARRGIVRREFTDELLAKHLPDAPGYYGEMVWILMMLEQWLLTHETTSSSASEDPRNHARIDDRPRSELHWR